MFTSHQIASSRKVCDVKKYLWLIKVNFRLFSPNRTEYYTVNYLKNKKIVVISIALKYLLRSISTVSLECLKSYIGNLNIFISSWIYRLGDIKTQLAIDPGLFCLDIIFTNRFTFTYSSTSYIFQSFSLMTFIAWYWQLYKAGKNFLKLSQFLLR